MLCSTYTLGEGLENKPFLLSGFPKNEVPELRLLFILTDYLLQLLSGQLRLV